MTHSQQTSLDLSKFGASEPSLCIPFVYTNITKERVQEVLEAVGFGDIERIDMVKRSGKDGKQDSQRVFIHFKQWNDTDTARQARQLLLDEKDIRIVYDDPWFWKIWASKSKKPTGDRKAGEGKSKAKPFVDFTSSSS